MRVAIIGAGITGLYIAWKLSEKGHQVTVFEKKEKIGKEVCSGLFSERILDFIPQISFSNNRRLIQNKIDFCLIHFPKKTLEVKFSKKFFIIDHSELDRLIGYFAEKAGANIILNFNITKNYFFDLEKNFDKIIGCDGALSETRKFLKLKEPKFFLGIQGFIENKEKVNFVETWPTKPSFLQKKEGGFLWKISRLNETEYGIMEDPLRAKFIFENFLKKNHINLKIIKSALIPQGFILSESSKITLCGDAIGLTKPWSGGGVIWSLLAAEILLKNFPNFIKYKKELKNFLLPRIILGKMAKKIIYFLGFNFPSLLPKNYKIESDFLI